MTKLTKARTALGVVSAPNLLVATLLALAAPSIATSSTATSSAVISSAVISSAATTSAATTSAAAPSNGVPAPSAALVEQARACVQDAKCGQAELPKAFALVERAAKAGDTMAAYYLGLMYRNGMAVERDPVEAARWLQLAANAQVPAAMLALARLHLAGDGVDRDDQAARHLIEKAADLDYPEAVMAMAIGLRDGSMGFERNEALAAVQLRLANRATGQGRQLTNRR